MFPRTVIPVYFVVLLAFLLSACSGVGSRQATPTPLPPLVNYEKAVYTVERGPIVEEEEITGEIVPAKQDELFFRTSGFVTRVSVKRGDVVKQGDVLAEMQIDDVLNQLQQANIDLEVARADLAKSTSQKEFEIEKAKADVAIWEQRVELAKMDVEDSYGRNRTRAQINLEITQQNLLLAEESLKLIAEDVKPFMEQAVKRSELAVQRLEGLVAERQIVAPYDGIVLRSVVRPGQQVDAFYVVLIVGDPAELVVRAQYDFDLAERLNQDSEVRLYQSLKYEQAFTTHYLPNFVPFRTLAEDAAESQSPGGDYLYFSAPENAPVDQFPVGRTVYLVVVLGRKENALLLPPAALREYKGLNFVIVKDGDRRRRVEISEIGLKTPERWEVTGDIKEGDQILGP